jgi:hypothetical protein
MRLGISDMRAFRDMVGGNRRVKRECAGQGSRWLGGWERDGGDVGPEGGRE